MNKLSAQQPNSNQNTQVVLIVYKIRSSRPINKENIKYKQKEK